MGVTTIEWAHYTFNPWIGCTHRSEGCRNCYAEKDAKRRGWAEWGLKADRHITADSTWKNPRKWNREAAAAGERKRVFCASLADVFDEHPQLPEPRAQLWQLIRETPALDWLLLTKRPENVAAMLPPDWGAGFRNVWLGTTVEDQRVIGRIDILRAIPAVLRFLSCEPLIGALDLREQLAGIGWVIAGGESGGNARPMHPEWARALRRACEHAGVPFMFKQWGCWSPADITKSTHLLKLDGTLVLRDTATLIRDHGFGRTSSEDLVDRGHAGWCRLRHSSKGVAGRVLDGSTYDGVPISPAALAAA